MIVYRDLHRLVDARAWLQSNAQVVRAQLALTRPDHDTAVRLLVEFGEIEAALCDRLMLSADGDTPEARALRRVALGIGHLLRCAWHGIPAQTCELPKWMDALPWEARVPSAPLRVKVPEGFAFYGLYPETYLEAAERFARSTRPGTAICIGLRSIGTALSAVVAAVLEAADWRVLTYTIRPRGEPFARRPVLAPSLKRALQRHCDDFALIVDEGPGLSGSSLAGTAETLRELGYRDHRIVLLPSWDPEPSRLSSNAASARWGLHTRYVGDFEENWLDSGRLGETSLRAQDGGRWRERYFDEYDYPAVQPQHERRKYITTQGSPRILKFAGLGPYGLGALHRARILAHAGHTPSVHELRHGFLIQPWVAGRPLTAVECDGELINTAARYLAFLQRTFPAQRRTSGEELGAMVAANVKEFLGIEGFMERLEIDRFEEANAVELDGRMQPWEWIVTTKGILKTDAVDHHSDHFFPGCTDIAWDLAGFASEFDLDQEGIALLLRRFMQYSGDRRIGGRFALFRVAYLAFRLAYARLAEQTTAGTPEALRFFRLGAGYRRQLRHALLALRGRRQGTA
jgi:hypothetical protein